MRHKTRAELCRATPHSAYPKNNFIRLVQKIITKTFLKRVVRPPIRAFVHSFEGVWLASDSSTCSNGLLCSLMLPVGQASRRSWPQGKRPTSQAQPYRRDYNGSRRRRAYPTWGLEAAERRLDLFPRWGSSLEFGWSQ